MRDIWNQLVRSVEKKRSLITVLTILILTAAASVLLLTGPKRGGNSAAHGKKTRTILLYGNEDPGDLEILRQRLDLFAGRGNYELAEEDGYLSLRIPATLFRSDTYLKLCLEEMLTGTGQLSISDAAADDPLSLQGTLTLAKVKEDTLRGVEIEHLYAPQEVQAGEDLPFLSTDLPPTRRLVLKVDEDTASRVEDALEKGRNLSLTDTDLYDDYPTLKYGSFRWIVTASPNDAGTLFIECDESEILYGHEELFTYNLTHPKLSRPYNCVITDEVTWEDPAMSNSCGTGQCRVDLVCASPGEPWVFFQASPGADAASDERESARRLLLQRLDLTGLPYALGQTEEGAFCVKIDASRISASIPDLLLAPASRESLNLYVPGSENLISAKYARTEYDKEKGVLNMYLSGESAGALQASVMAYGSKLQENHEEQGAAAADEKTVPVYLRKDSIPLAGCRLDPAFDGNVLTFEDCILPDNGEDHSWFAALIQNIANTSDSSIPFLSIDYMYVSRDGHLSFDAGELPVQEQSLCPIESIAEKVRKILPGATVSLDPNRLTPEIHMNLPADGELIRNIFSLVPALLNAGSMDSGCHEQVRIFPLEPVGDERCWLTFSRDVHGSIGFSGYLYNGRLDAYSEELAQAVKEDAFFQSMILSEYNGWFYRSPR